MVNVAETINELKRRQELVGKIVKLRVRSDGYVQSSKRSGHSSNKQRSASAAYDLTTPSSSSSLTGTVSKKFRRQSNKVKSVFATRTDLPPASDSAFDAVVASMEARQRAIHNFVLDAKAWSKAVRTMLLSLLQFSMVWTQVYAPLPGEPPEQSQSGRTIEYFARNVVKSCIEGPWNDLDNEIKNKISPKVSELLDLFRNPRAVIAKRNSKLADCNLPSSVKGDKVLRESAAAYHALNAQLLAELPAFLHAVETFFTAIVGRFIALQTAFQRVMCEKWSQYALQCCTQLGALGQPANSNLSAWWTIHKPVVDQLDSLKILAAGKSG